jgi:hypothetical protein
VIPRSWYDFARGLERIEFRSEDPPPGSWRGMETPRGPEYFTKDDLTKTRARGVCVVDGREYPFRLIQKNPHREELPVDGWLQFEKTLPFLTGRSWGDGFEIMLESKLNPENDWLYLWFGRNLDGSASSAPCTA